MVFFSVLCLFALAFAALFFIIWIIKVLLKKKTKMWLAAIVSLVVAISSFIAYGVIHDAKQVDTSSPSEQVSATSYATQAAEESTTTTKPQTTRPTTEPTSATSEPAKSETSKSARSGLLAVLLLAALLTSIVLIFLWIVIVSLGKDHKKASIAAITSGVITFVLFFAFIGTYSDGNETKEQTAQSTSHSVSASTERSTTEQTTTTEATTTSPTTTTLPTTTTTTTEKATTTTKPQKKLSDYRFKSADIIGDDGDPIGKRGYVKMEWDTFDNASDREIHDFLERAYFNRYDYINIFFDNGTTLWSWGFADMFQIGDTPDQGYGAVKYDADNLDGIRGRYIWIGTHYDYS